MWRRRNLRECFTGHVSPKAELGTVLQRRLLKRSAMVTMFPKIAACTRVEAVAANALTLSPCASAAQPSPRQPAAQKSRRERHSSISNLGITTFITTLMAVESMTLPSRLSVRISTCGRSRKVPAGAESERRSCLTSRASMW